jgi:hypothetical protein
MDSLPHTGQAGSLSHDVIVTPAMVEAGALELTSLLGAKLETEICSAQWLAQKVLEAALSYATSPNVKR